MTLMHNPFVGKEETILICYDELIKSPYPYVLHQIANSVLKSHYEGFIHLFELEGMDMNNLTRLCVQRTTKNIFEYIAAKEFDYNGSMKELIDRYPFIYNECPTLPMGSSIRTLLGQKFTQKIYVYTEVYDSRIHMDIQNLYSNMIKVNYVTGPFVDVVQKLGSEITAYILNDIDLVPQLFTQKVREHINVMVARLGFNFTMSEELKKPILKIDFTEYREKFKANFSDFMPVEMDSSFFSQIAKG